MKEEESLEVISAGDEDPLNHPTDTKNSD